MITHLHRELMHEVWGALLDEEFIDAWNYGIVIECADTYFTKININIMSKPPLRSNTIASLTVAAGRAHRWNVTLTLLQCRTLLGDGMEQ
jgi:hypothetical protein